MLSNVFSKPNISFPKGMVHFSLLTEMHIGRTKYAFSTFGLSLAFSKKKKKKKRKENKNT